MSKKVQLRNIMPGQTFEIWGKKFTVLKQYEDKVFVLAAEFATTMQFSEEGKECKIAPNDFRDSSVKEYLNGEYIGSLIAAGSKPKKDIIPLRIELDCVIEEHECNIDIVEAGLLTLEQYAEFYDIIPLIKNDCWCLASSYPNNSVNVWSVYTDGDYGLNYASSSFGVRPVLNLSPTLLVEPVNQEDRWGEYIKYLYTWTDEHTDNAYLGCSPVCYDEWLDNKYDEV